MIFLFVRLIILLITLSGCSYQFGYGGLLDDYKTITIPYATGDDRGELTTEVIRQISGTGALRYQSDEGDLILKMRLIEFRDENIGFRYDRKKDGKLKKAIIPTETRLFASAEITVIEAASGNIVTGPVIITASVDFDHDYYDMNHASNNRLSLGQLNDIDAAHDAVLYPLNRKLAGKIVDYIVNNW